MLSSKRVKTEYLPKVLTRSVAGLLKPNWLQEGEYGSSEWIVVDDLPSSPKPAVRIRWNVQLFDPRRPNEICRLTDPQYSALLDTIKQQSWGLRIGRHATVSTAYTHEEMTRYCVNWVLWMVGNSIYRFLDLDQDDFQAYIEAACFGPGYLLGFAPRLAKYIEQLKARGAGFPFVKKLTVSYLDAFGLLQAAGIDPSKGGMDPATSYMLAEVAAESGFKLKLPQIERLSKGPPPPNRLSEIGVMRTLQPWAYQWLMRSNLTGDRIQFNPFEESSMRRVSMDLGRPGRRTKTAPVRQTMELLDYSIRWVLDYAPALLRLRDKYFELAATGICDQTLITRMAAIISRAEIPDGPARPFPLNASSKKSPADGLALGIAVNQFIPTACAVVICAFTGRRYGEVLTARSNGPTNGHCITHDEDGYWFETFIEKTCRDWVKTPCNEVVAAAVAVLDHWSAPARAQSGKNSLFQLRRFKLEPIVSFDLRESLKVFSHFLKLTPLPDGTQWNFTPHQFRRFLAILYFWGYQYRNLGALSYHLRHLDPVTTQIYVTEPDAGMIFKKVDAEHTITLLSETAIGERNLSAAFGERFKSIVSRLYRRYRRSVRVIDPKLVRKAVERYVTNSGRRLKTMSWGYCACGSKPHELNTARCLRISTKQNLTAPDFGSSSPTICCGCPHHATEKTFEPFLRIHLDSHERAARDPNNGPVLRATSKELGRMLRVHCKKSFDDSTPLEALNVESH